MGRPYWKFGRLGVAWRQYVVLAVLVVSTLTMFANAVLTSTAVV